MTTPDSRLYRAAYRLFEKLNYIDEAALYEFILDGTPLPAEPSSLKLQRWIYRRWGIDMADHFATVPQLKKPTKETK